MEGINTFMYAFKTQILDKKQNWAKMSVEDRVAAIRSVFERDAGIPNYSTKPGAYDPDGTYTVQTQNILSGLFSKWIKSY